MERILLYYPAINIPDGNWLRNSLLYTDKVASIVPFVDMNDKRVDDDTKLLYDNGFYKPISVFNNLNPSHKEFNKFQENFINTIESKEFKAYQKVTKDYPWGQDNGITDYSMYAEKLSHEIVDFLGERNLLKRGNYGVMTVEKNSAIIYMSMLADYLASISSDWITPSTDEQEFEKLTFQLADKKVLTYRLQLESCLPTPSPDTDIKDIIKFKKARQQEMLQFRAVLDTLEQELRNAEDQNEKKLKLIQFQENLQKELLEIKKLLGDSKLDFILNGFSSLLDFKQKEVVGTVSGLGLASAGVVASLPFLGLGAGALLLTGTLISSYKKINRQVEANSSSYIYYAQKAGLLEK
ncbi:hypothetical protein DR864_05925 [Runella rosea]|uniref:Uncharacterized protein n=1 Tax=Runella rosea TaxID=2259595 RepID=A0A344TF79_9BACT|nr:DUF6236 family protein [Runella rosea]AXE17300.1 hypothetical protein DR864_05925 [Runella rosea]